ncbi:MAG: tetratricopeptide repeat protein [Longimicrobiales bacterium]
MKGSAKLKDHARGHEQREEWEAAIDIYLRVLKDSDDRDVADLPLYNRVGDLYLRLGRSDDAVRYYEQAAAQYAEAELYNNAIALCNKALRYAPSRLDLLRRLGVYSASQGFLTDARHWFLEFAERAFRKGEMDAAFGSLEEFARISEEAEIRELLARKLQAHGRQDDAVKEFRRAYRMRVRASELDAAEALRQEVLELLPDLDLGATAESAADDGEDSDGESAGFGLPTLGDTDEDGVPTARGLPGLEPTHRSGAARGASERPGRLEGFEQTSLTDSAAAAAADPTNRAGDAEPVRARKAADASPVADGVAPAHEERADQEESDLAATSPRLPAMDGTGPEPADTEESPDDWATRSATGAPDDWAGQAAVGSEEWAAHAGPSSEEWSTPASKDWSTSAPADVNHVGTAPANGAASESWVDLSDLLGVNEPHREETRFFVEETDPTGDEDRDFADLLAQFKQKLSEHIAHDDIGSHYDLGLAFKEMGLLDEAVNQFQTALRAGSTDRLKIYEELGHCFLMKQQYKIAVKVLSRALQFDHGDEIELIGVYYLLGRSYEEMHQSGEAMDAYERVVGLDIAFKDVAERMARL